MARSRPSIMKRKRERARQERRQFKLARRAQRSADKQQAPGGGAADPDHDPDIAHIVPGPQPLPWDDLETDVQFEFETAV